MKLLKICGRQLLAIGLLLTAVAGIGQQDVNKSVGVVPKSGPLQGITAYTDSYALFVGISDYSNSEIPTIASAENDAKTMRDLLVSKFGFNPDPQHTIVLLGANATRQRIERELARLSDTKRIKPTDRVLVYFSGHGQRVPLPNGEATGYLIPFEATINLKDVSNPSEYQSSCLDIEDVVKRLTASPARHRAIILDACFSGFATGSKGFADGKVMSADVLKRLLDQRGVSIMTAGTSEDEAIGSTSRTGLSAFTRSITEALEKADVNGGTFTLGEIASDVKTKTRELSNGKQNPQFGVRDGVGEMILFTSVSATLPLTPKSLSYANLKLTGTLNNGDGLVFSTAFSPDGTTLAIGDLAGNINLWDLRAGSIRKTLKGHKSWVASLAFSAAGLTLASGGNDAKVMLWNVSDGTPQKTLEGHESKVVALAFTADGSNLLSVSSEATTKIWKVSSGALVKTVDGHYFVGKTAVAFSPDEKMLLTANQIWDIADMGRKVMVGVSGTVTSATFSADSRKIAIAEDNYSASIWDVESGKLLKTLVGHSDDIVAMTFSPDGSIVATGSNDSTVKIWDVATGTLLKTLTGEPLRITSVRFSPDGATLLTSNLSGNVSLWRVRQ